MKLTISCLICFVAAFDYAAAVESSFYYEAFLKGLELNSIHFENYVFSPMSLVPPLGVLALGSQGTSRREILDVLGDMSITDMTHDYQGLIQGLVFQYYPKYDIKLKLFVQNYKEVNHRFARVANSLFGLEIGLVDFSNRRQTDEAISEWVRNQTDRKIQDALLPLYGFKDINAVLVNAINFEGAWEKPFNNEGLQHFEGRFRLVDYMGKNGYFDYYNSSLLQAELMSIPYNNSKCGLLLVNPHEDSNVENIINQLQINANVINQEVEKLHNIYAHLSVPKFAYYSFVDVDFILKDMGVNQIFTKDAKLHRILKDGSDLMVKLASQGVYLEIDEVGTHGASSSQATLQPPQLYSIGMTYLHVKVKKPFYFEVRCANTILYNGVIKDPNSHIN